MRFPFSRRRIAVVGNGPIAPEAAERIDKADTVIRFNMCDPWGGHAGTKTDILVLSNSGYPAERFAFWPGYIKGKVAENVKEIWLIQSPALLRAGMDRAASFEEQEYFADFTHDILVELETRARFMIFDRALHEEVRGELKARGATNLFFPSAGILTIAHLRRAFPSTRIECYGFTHEGWKFHPWNAERRLLDDWIAARGSPRVVRVT